MVEFVSYDGAYPNLCSGTLVLKINGKERELSHCLCSCGGIQTDDYGMYATEGEWNLYDLPEDLEPLLKEIKECVNENVPHGCCGGCI